MAIFGKYFSSEQIRFLNQNWYSFDAIDIQYSDGKKKIILYEVKTRNKYSVDLPYKPKMTLETHNLYHQAKELGLIPVIATVWLLDNWQYDLEIKDFNPQDYYIDSPKLYDKRARG